MNPQNESETVPVITEHGHGCSHESMSEQLENINDTLKEIVSTMRKQNSILQIIMDRIR